MGAVSIPRYEAFFKDESGLRRSLKFLLSKSEGSVIDVNLPNKAKTDDVLSWLDAIEKDEELRGRVRAIAHYSMKNNYLGNAEARVRRVKSFAKGVASRGGDRALLVSGSGSRVSDTVEILRRLSSDREWKRERGSFAFDVAFNPYFPEAADLARERERLALKLKSNMVRGVWFQIGCDLNALEAGIESARAIAGDAGTEVELFGSVFLPTKSLLARMKFRPWAGVYLSEEYLSSVESAERITKAQLEVFARHGVTQLIESPILTDADFAQCQRLLGVSSGTKRARETKDDGE